MSIFSKWISRPISCPERELQERYLQMISLLPTGITFSQVRQKVKEAIRHCKEEAVREGSVDLPWNYGEFLLQAAQAGDAHAKKIIANAHGEGATDEDIREYWNLDDLERRMIAFYESLFLTVMAQSLKKSGLSEEAAKEIETEVRKTFPVYGDPDDRSVTSGRDRPLPYELRARVNRWRTKLVYEDGEKGLKEKANRHSTFNALVRVEIQKGNL